MACSSSPSDASSYMTGAELVVRSLSAVRSPTRHVGQPAISRHLKVLEGAGLIVRRVEGTKRRCRLAPSGIAKIDQWLAILRNALAKNYDRLDEVLDTMDPKEDRACREQHDD